MTKKKFHSSQKKRILITISRLGIGGVQKFVQNLANELAKHDDFDVSVFVYYPDYIFEIVKPNFDPAISVYSLTKSKLILILVNKLSKGFEKFLSIQLKKKLITLYFFGIKWFKSFEIIHLNSVELFLPFINKEKGVHYVATLHSCFKEAYKRNDPELLEKLKKYINVISVSVYLSEDNLVPFESFFQKEALSSLNFIKINNGMPAPRKLKKFKMPGEKIVFGMVARGIYEKGWETVFQAAEILNERGFTEFEVHLYCDGDIVNEFCKKYVTPSIIYHGETKFPVEKMQEFDVGLLPTFADEMPYTIIEYLSCSLPVIATNVGAIEYMLTDNAGNLSGTLLNLNKQGRLDIQDLVSAMKNYLDFPQLINKHSHIAWNNFQEKFSIQKCTEEYIKLYKSLLNTH